MLVILHFWILTTSALWLLDYKIFWIYELRIRFAGREYWYAALPNLTNLKWVEGKDRNYRKSRFSRLTNPGYKFEYSVESVLAFVIPTLRNETIFMCFAIANLRVQLQIYRMFIGIRKYCYFLRKLMKMVRNHSISSSWSILNHLRLRDFL